jgi:16S rRNA (uracil1498-N3)-methyltransferase
MPHRFYAPALDATDETIALPDDEAQHLVRVLRLERGDHVRVFNGRGLERLARVELADTRGVVLRVAGTIDPVPELPFAVTLAQAVLKGDRMDDTVRDAVMLGVTAVQPLLTRHVAVPSAQLGRDGRRERWERIAVSSAKQCGRAVVPPIRPLRPLREVLEDTAPLRLVLVEPRAHAAAQPVRELPVPSAPGAVVLAGPEGGWSSDEIEEAAAAGATLVTLGARTLRADAIALVALPVLLHHWDVL